MVKKFTSLGLMSGTSMDGIDASIIVSDGIQECFFKFDKYLKYSENLRTKLLKTRDKVLGLDDLTKFSDEIKELEKEITICHAEFVNSILNDQKIEIDIIGFHGQTIFHSPKKRFSKQIGDGMLLSQLTKKKVIYNFRQEDIKNGGDGAPLAPIFHKLIVELNEIKIPVCILNIGGISNATIIYENSFESMISKDLGPGNCLIDEWIRLNNFGDYDENGNLAGSGKINTLVLNQALDIYDNKNLNKTRSFDIKDFDIGFLRGLNLEEGAATITEFSSKVITDELSKLIMKLKNKNIQIILCGGGRKNQFLVNSIKQKINLDFVSFDDYNLNSDFIESQCFAYLAIRSYLNLPFTFPNTTGCIKASTGGTLVENF